MTEPVSGSGTKIYIAGAVTAEPADAAAYQALTWIEIKEVETIGEYGDEKTVTSFAVLGDDRVKKVTGSSDAGTLTITVVDIPDDAGQVAAKAAQAMKYNYPFKIVSPNRLTVAGTDQIDYLIGPVASQRKGQTTPNGELTRVFTVAINSKFTTVAPT